MAPCSQCRASPTYQLSGSGCPSPCRRGVARPGPQRLYVRAGSCFESSLGGGDEREGDHDCLLLPVAWRGPCGAGRAHVLALNSTLHLCCASPTALKEKFLAFFSALPASHSVRGREAPPPGTGTAAISWLYAAQIVLSSLSALEQAWGAVACGLQCRLWPVGVCRARVLCSDVRTHCICPRCGFLYRHYSREPAEQGRVRMGWAGGRGRRLPLLASLARAGARPPPSIYGQFAMDSNESQTEASQLLHVRPPATATSPPTTPRLPTHSRLLFSVVVKCAALGPRTRSRHGCPARDAAS